MWTAEQERGGVRLGYQTNPIVLFSLEEGVAVLLTVHRFDRFAPFTREIYQTFRQTHVVFLNVDGRRRRIEVQNLSDGGR